MKIQIIIFLILRISFLQATEIQCETDLKNPVTFGSDVTVTCTSKVQEIRELLIRRPSSTLEVPFRVLPDFPQERLQVKLKSNQSYVFVILNTTFQDSGNWELYISTSEGRTSDGIVSNVKDIPLFLKIVKHPSKVHFEDENPIIVNLGHDSERILTLNCIAENTYPEPTFEWFLDDQQLESKNQRIDEIENETFKSSFDIKIERTKGKSVTCQVYHSLSMQRNTSTVIEPHFYPYDVQPQPLKFYSLWPNYSNPIELSFQASHQPENVTLTFGQEKVNLTINWTQILDVNFNLILEFFLNSKWIEEKGQLKIGKSEFEITFYDLSEEELYTRVKFNRSMIIV